MRDSDEGSEMRGKGKLRRIRMKAAESVRLCERDAEGQSVWLGVTVWRKLEFWHFSTPQSPERANPVSRKSHLLKFLLLECHNHTHPHTLTHTHVPTRTPPENNRLWVTGAKQLKYPFHMCTLQSAGRRVWICQKCQLPRVTVFHYLSYRLLVFHGSLKISSSFLPDFYYRI